MASSTDPHRSPARITVEGERIAVRARQCELDLSPSEALLVIDELQTAVSRIDDLALWAEDDAAVEKPGPWETAPD